MKVVYIKAVENAKAGDVKEVADGYARNFLLPRGLARAATPEQLKALAGQQQAEARRVAKVKSDAEALAQRIGTVSLQFEVKAGAQKRLHGSITAQDMADQLKKQHQISIDKRDVKLAEPIKHVGDFEVLVHVGHGLEPKLKVVVTAAEG